MEKKNKAEVFNQKLIEQSTRFVQQVLVYQQEAVEQITRLDKDMNAIFNRGRKEINQVHYQAMNKASETMNRIMAEEEKKIAEIRSMKLPSSVYAPAKPAEPVSNFVKLKLKYRKVIRISKNWKANKIPRPVWGIVFEYCDNLSLAKLERVCKSFFLLINPLCACTDTKGDSSCRSVWMTSASADIKEQYPDGNCCFFRRVAVREKTTSLFTRSLQCIKEIACNKGTHDWEVNPTNENFFRCPSCFKGAKRSEYCKETCSEHMKSCQNEVGKFSVCRNHACIICKFPQVRNSCRIVGYIKEACSSYVVHPAVKLTFKDEFY